MKSTLETVKGRAKLAGEKVHSDKLMLGGHLLYVKSSPKEPGIFSVRLVNSETGKQKKTKIGPADDFTKADGLLIFDYAQAKNKAFELLKELAKEFEEGILGRITISHKDYTVANAVFDYLEYLNRQGKKSIRTCESMFNAHVLPELGDIKVSRLSKEKLEDWKFKMSITPRRKQIRISGIKCKTVLDDKKYENMTDEEKRKRKDTANHVLLLVKIALNFALKNGRIEQPSRGMWKDAEFFEGVKGVRNTFLSIQEQKRLINSCENQDFKNLVIAALMTGGRYMEIASLTVSDYIKSIKKIRFGPFGKVKGKIRYVILTDEAVSFFDNMVEGKSGSDLIFTRETYRFKTTKEKNPEINGRWVEEDQSYYMRNSCKIAELSNVCFHSLRHTFASNLVNKGVNLMAIAEALGHKDTTMVQKHYGHLEPSLMDEAIRNAQEKLLN